MADQEDGKERSESGAPIYRYEEPVERGYQAPDMSHSNMEEISDHIEKHIGKIESVYHEIVSDLIHIDVHQVPPTEERPFWTLVTSGMSDLPMSPPEGAEDLGYAELMICLPGDWPLDEQSFKDEGNYWPIRNLKFLARFPHDYKTWLFYGHTLPNGDPPEEFAPGAGFTGMLLAPPLTAPPEFMELAISPEKTIHFLALVPLYSEEMDLKLKKGVEALEPLFDKHGVFELLQIGRKNVAKKKFGLF
ncbi:MAG: suppressor of fused domain protein [Verrucomicrobiales bacterium]|nr:suppressor of fused domain protein [Verrucomicrobiales bacterium]